MSGCNNSQIGLKLHAFELGMLSDKDQNEFEEHLLECSYCFNLVIKDKDKIKILNSDKEIQREIIEEVDTTGQNGNKSFRLPKTIIWIAIAAVLTIIFVLQNNSDLEMQSQTIRFNRLRAAGPAIVDLELGGQVRFELPVEGYSSLDSIKLMINSIDNRPVSDTILYLSEMDEPFAMVVPLSVFSKGLYTIKVQLIANLSDSVAATFTFRVK